MNEPFDKLRETSWRRKLTAAEEDELRAQLEVHPEALADWEADAALNQVLDRLPDAPMPSNFTARIMQAVELEQAAAARRPGSPWKWLWGPIFPKAALAAVFVGMSLLGFREAVFQKQQRLAKSVAAVSQVAALPGPEILQDFDAIQQLNQTPAPDTEWLALLQ